VALYDVADPARPERLDLLRYTTGWSASPALWDPHALLQVEDVLALPVYDWDPRWRSGVSGLSVVQITGDRLMELGRIDHGPMARERCASGGSGEREPAPGELVDLDEGRVAGAPDAACASSWPEMRRAVAIEQVLFAVSDAGVSAHPLHSPEVILAEVPAPPRARDVTGKPLPEDDLAPRQEQGRPDAAR
jgi:hypothetical protein